METREQGALRLFNSACECIESEKYKEAYDYLVRSSELSGTDARYILGIWYLFGVDCIDLKQNIWGAIFCLIKSAYKGNMSSKIFLKTFLDIDIDALNLTEENINSTIKNIVIYKCKDIESTTKEDKSKILEYIKNPYIVQPIMKNKQITLEKPTLLEQHNISIQHNREKHAEYKPKLIYTKKQMNASLLVELIKEIKQEQKEMRNMYNILTEVLTQQAQIQNQTILSQNGSWRYTNPNQQPTQNPAYIVETIEPQYPQFNAQEQTQNPVYTETMQPHQALQHDVQYYQTQLHQLTNATNRFNVPAQTQNEYNYPIQ